MGTKRSADETEQLQSRPRRQNAKRARLSPIEDANSSDPSSCSVSEDSALQSSPPISEHTRQSSLSSLQPSNREEDSDENLSSSNLSSSTSDDISSSELGEVITIGGPKKPEISSSLFSDGAEDLRSRLSTLLPRLAEANQTLHDGRDSYSMEEVEEDEQHIEMNLGLGVLEERGDDDSSSSSEESSDGQEQGGDARVPFKSKTQSKESKADVMGDLLGRQDERQKVGIEDLG